MDAGQGGPLAPARIHALDSLPLRRNLSLRGAYNPTPVSLDWTIFLYLGRPFLMPKSPRHSLPILLLAFSLIAQTLPGAAAGAGPSGPSTQPMQGFSATSAAEQRALEARFDATLRPENLREWMKKMTEHAHHVGSPWGKQNAELAAGLFRSWGYETRIETFKVLFPTPKTRLVEMIAPTRFTAKLVEPPIAEDSTSKLQAEQLPTYNAYSTDGDVTGELVYVNFGTPRDYEELERRGIDVNGKIVIARYGGAWRGIKPKVAGEHGAVGCIIYSDPADDGYGQGDVYPKGGWRPEGGAQRGSVSDGVAQYSGDPLTPGVGATEDAERLAVKDAKTITKIPVLPISYSDALPLLKAIEGPMAPDDWKGGLPIRYRIGPGPAKVHLKLEFNWDLAPAYDVIAKMPGGERPDQWIVRGNHHDGWVYGASDPVSGAVALLEEARAVAELAKSGWKPKRTLVYALWDAEEPGLIGSTEWVETHAAELSEHAAVYINSDSNARGFLGIAGSNSLETLANEAARDVTDPEKGISVRERALAGQRLFGGRDAGDGKSIRLGPLGSGSDYTPFYQHLGIASYNVGFGGEEEYGQYHSIYDSFDHYVRFVDPTFQYGVTLAKLAGRLSLRLANADVLPLDPGGTAATIDRYTADVMKATDDLRRQTEERNQMIDDKVFQSVDDPTQPYWTAPKKKDPVPYLNFSPIQNAVATVKASAAAYAKAYGAATSEGKALSAAAQLKLDAILLKLERALTTKEGLPRRSWYIHQLDAPGAYTGYGAKTIPGVREAIEARNWKEAAEQIEIVARTLNGWAAQVDAATGVLGGAK
jgi:N-acetylated-alpha-linked acidic dipeptidase